jgi:hypothetical protein
VPRPYLPVLALVCLALAFSGCAGTPVATEPPPATATVEVTATATPTATASPATATASIDLSTFGSRALVILYTNDVRGHTEPCG